MEPIVVTENLWKLYHAGKVELSGQHLEINAAQRRNFHFSRVIQLPKIFGNDDWLHSQIPCGKQRIGRRTYCSRDWHF